jgi:N-carbamoyl-L-amino-acid hydrolase
VHGHGQPAGNTPRTAGATARGGRAWRSIVGQRAAQDGDSWAPSACCQVPTAPINSRARAGCLVSLDLRAPSGNRSGRPWRGRARPGCGRSASAADCAQRGGNHARADAAPSAPEMAAGAGKAPWPVAGRARCTACQRRRPRRDEAARGDAAGDAVRARQNSGISHNPLESTTSDDMQLACAPSSTCSTAAPRTP